MTTELSINARARAIKPSATLAVSARAASLRAEGKQVLNFSAGGRLRAPSTVTRAVIDQLDDSRSVRAGPGLPALRDAAAAGSPPTTAATSPARDPDLLRRQQPGNLFLVTLSPGDEVVITPYWVSYPVMVELAGGTSVFVEGGLRRDSRWHRRSSPQARSKTRFVVLNNPSNPTGVGYTAGRCAPWVSWWPSARRRRGSSATISTASSCTTTTSMRRRSALEASPTASSWWTSKSYAAAVLASGSSRRPRR